MPSRFAAAVTVALATLTALAAQAAPAPPAPAPPGEPTTRFRNTGQSFQLDLPAGWRQLAPNEARRLGENPRAPLPLRFAQPHLTYAVGPVDQWLADRFDAPFVHVAESQEPWHLGDDFATALADAWQRLGQARGETHTLRSVVRERVGTQQVEAIVAVRLAAPTAGGPAIQSLDVHCPDGGRQVTLSFCSPPEQFATHEPSFRRWLATLTFARIPKAPATLSDRLWPAAITSAIVCLLLWYAWRRTRARR
jgi:hypothetical protein